MKTPSAIERLLDNPHRFGFFQAVRLLERWLQNGLPPGDADVLARRLAFRNPLSLAFPPSEIAALKIEPKAPDDADGAGAPAPASPDAPLAPRSVARVELTPAFFNLLGAGGALPTHYTELVAEREARWRGPEREAPRAFYDIFLHRATALFYQAWRKHRLAVQFETDRRNRALPLMLAVAGLGHAGLRDRLRAREGGIADDTVAFYAATLQHRPVSVSALQRLLQHYFSTPVRVDSFIGRWFTLPEANRSHLGLDNMQLGRDAVVGERVWQRDLRLRLTFGPLPRERFNRFLPGGPAAIALKELLALLTGVTLEYEVRLVLRAEDVRGIGLGAAAPRLGWDSFLLTGASPHDRSDAGYDLLALA
ncbi:MAG: type VI secretion system baseplate subunit TssG [Pseudorhodoferax sp.]